MLKLFKKKPHGTMRDNAKFILFSQYKLICIKVRYKTSNILKGKCLFFGER